MSESSTRARVYAIVNAVSNVGLVYDYARWAVLWDEVLALFKTTIGSTDMIRGWVITCTGWTSAYLDGLYPDDNGKAIELRDYTYKIRGVFSLDDSAATEKTAVGIVEDVAEALNKNTSLHSYAAIAEPYFGPIPPASLDVFEARMFGSVLCHYAEITQRVVEAIVPA